MSVPSPKQRWIKKPIHWIKQFLSWPFYNESATKSRSHTETQKQPLDLPPTTPIQQQETSIRSAQRRNNETPVADNESYCNTFSTSSTDYNREINVLRFYQDQQQQQQNSAAPMDILSNKPESSPVKKKKFFRFCKLFRKMKLTAEKPFWSIDRYFDE